MFIGHFALGLAAKRAVPRVSLGLLFGAAQLADLLWPLFLAAGLEQVRIDPGNTAFTPLAFVSYPYSHSLALLVLWGVAVGVVASAIAVWPNVTSLPAAPTLLLVGGLLAGIVVLNLTCGWLIFRWSLRDLRPGLAQAAR